MHAPRPAVARRDLGAVPRLPADRPRRGLRHDADLGVRRHHRPVRRDALRRQRRRSTCTRASAGRWARSTPARSDGDPVTLQDHGPRTGHRLRDGQRQAGRDLVEALELRQGRRSTSCSTAASRTARCTSPKTFFKAAAQTPQTFNSFYIDNKHIAEYTSGLLPMRPKSVDPGLPTKGTGQYEWRGFLSARASTSAGHRSRRTGRSSTGTTASPTGFGAADDELGPQRLGRAGRPAQPEPEAAAGEATASGRWRR